MWLLKSSRLPGFPAVTFSMSGFSSAASTIFALSSGQGKCGVAVIRVSGSRAAEAILRMTKPAANSGQLPKPRMATLQTIRDPVTCEELDKGLVLWFPGPRSFTGEDSCEFQVHGGPAVVASILAGLSKLPGFRPAEPGDFTKRAFFAGKLDLTEVEGLADLIHAETELQRRQAFFQMEGNLGSIYGKWREALKRNLANVEAYIDFSEEENIEDNILEVANESLAKLKSEIESHLNDGRRGERLRDGIRTTIIGEPNAGKSSLLNAICQRPAAIVTPVPGTTRDAIEINVNISGFPMVLTDTAGLRRDTSDVVEKEGILRARAFYQKSDLVLFIVDAEKLIKDLPSISEQHVVTSLKNNLEQLDLKSADEAFHNPNSDTTPRFIVILNKIDLLSEGQRGALLKVNGRSHNINYISCKTEEGFKPLLENMTQQLQQLCGNPSRESPTLTQSRHRHHLNASLELLTEYFEFINEDVSIAAQKLRLSLRHLGKIIGVVTTEEILDVIFKDFCVGK